MIWNHRTHPYTSTTSKFHVCRNKDKRWTTPDPNPREWILQAWTHIEDHSMVATTWGLTSEAPWYSDRSGIDCVKQKVNPEYQCVCGDLVTRRSVEWTPLSQVDQALLRLCYLANKRMLSQQRNVCRHMWYAMCRESARVVWVRPNRILFFLTMINGLILQGLDRGL